MTLREYLEHTNNMMEYISLIYYHNEDGYEHIFENGFHALNKLDIIKCSNMNTLIEDLKYCYADYHYHDNLSEMARLIVLGSELKDSYIDYHSMETVNPGCDCGCGGDMVDWDEFEEMCEQSSENWNNQMKYLLRIGVVDIASIDQYREWD